MNRHEVHKSSRRTSRSKCAIVLDLATGTVSIEGHDFTEQWAELYAVLVDAARVGAAWVTANELKTVGRWRHKTLRSVGSEVDRHVKDLARMGLAGVVESPPRKLTKQWRLVRPDAVAVVPDSRRVGEWLVSRQAMTAGEDLVVSSARGMVRASLEFQRGRMQEALEHIQTLHPVASSAWSAWKALLLARIQVRYSNKADGDWDQVRAELDLWKRQNDAVGRATAARLQAVLAYGHRTDLSRGALQTLKRLAARLEHSGDLASLAMVVNVVGLLTQRQSSEEPELRILALRDAQAHFERAAGLFGFIGDPWSLQAALFNAARALRAELAMRGEMPNDKVFALLDLCLEVCDGFHVGDDSIQAEALGARAAWEAGRNDLAAAYCERAEARGNEIDSDFEQAVLYRLRGRRARVEKRTKQAQEYLEVAINLFHTVGDDESAESVREELRSLDVEP